MRFHETFKNIHKGVLRSTKQLMQYPLHDDPAEVVEKFETWAAAVCDVYNMPVVRVELRGPETLGGFDGGCHVPDHNIIILTRPSLLVLFHQFRHHAQKHGAIHNNSELDAHGWACSLLYQTDPAFYRRMVYEFAVPGVHIDELQPEEPASISYQPEQASLSEEEQRIFDDISDSFLEDLDPASELGQLMEEIAEEGTAG